MCASLLQCLPFDSSWSWWKIKLLRTSETLLMSYAIKLKKMRHSKTRAFTKSIFCHASGSQLLTLTWAVNSKLDETAELSSHLEFLEHSKIYTAFNASIVYTWKSHWLKTSDIYINFDIRISNRTAQVFQAIFSPPAFLFIIYLGSPFERK